jgi:NhaA family Na+:H+ antiporter
MVAAAIALGWANSPWRAAYTALWATPATLRLANLTLRADLRDWVGDGLMAVFFLVVGLEIKRELVAGELRTWRRAALPVVAAAGGMAVPALVYAAVNAGRPGAPGWGVPMATDIAFAIGVLALLGPRVQAALKVFLLTLAVVDDLGSVAVVAVGYGGSGISPGPGRGGRRPARAGGRADPAGRAAGGRPAPGQRLPCGVAVRPGQRRGVAGTGGAGRARGGGGAGRGGGRAGAGQGGRDQPGRLAGRPPRPGRPTRGDHLGQLAGAATVAGIGFTVPLFVADLAFPDGRLLAPVKLGLVAASVVSGLAGALVLVRAGARLGGDQAG